MKIRCEACRYFVPDPINPPAGMGECKAGLPGWHAGAPHYCTKFREAV